MSRPPLAADLVELLVHPRVFHPHSWRASSRAQVHEGIPPLRRCYLYGGLEG